MTTQYALPPHLYTPDGEVRRVGVEIELSGLDLLPLCALINMAYGGRIQRQSDYEYAVVDTELGDFGVELDFSYLKQYGKEHADQAGRLERVAHDTLADVAKRVVPGEIVAPPIPCDQLHRLDELTTLLRNNGAKGTQDALHYAFGVHLNPELHSLDADTIGAQLKAFVCLYVWLAKRESVDLSRKLTPYIAPFPEAYAKHLLADDYQPDLPTLIDDYLKFNPTRNRALDMLPLFRHLDEARVLAQVEDDRINARPTHHYRLPNSEFGEGEWSLARCWNDWVWLERVADEPAALDELCGLYRQQLDGLTPEWLGLWHNKLETWMAQQSEALSA